MATRTNRQYRIWRRVRLLADLVTPELDRAEASVADGWAALCSAIHESTTLTRKWRGRQGPATVAIREAMDAVQKAEAAVRVAKLALEEAVDAAGEAGKED